MAVGRVLIAGYLVAAVAVAEEKTEQVDVLNTDGKGKGVRGLPAADFQAVRDRVANPVLTAAEAAEPAARRIVILFDNGSLSLAHRRHTAAAFKSCIEANLRPVDHVAIA